MATTNIQELLTQGLFTQPAQQPTVDPRARLTGMELLTSEALKAGDESARLFSEGGNLLRRELIGLTPEEQLGEELQNLDLSTPEGLTRLAEIQRMTGDLEGSLQTLGTLQGMAQEQTLREGLIKIARQQDNEMLVDYINAGGDLSKVEEYLFKEQAGAKTSAPPSKADMKLYGNLLEQYTDKDLERLGLDTNFKLFGIGGGLDSDIERIIINNAKEIFTNKPALGKKGALDIALRQYGMSQSEVDTPTDVVESSSQMTGAPIR